MTLAYFHVISNHLPIFGIPVALLFFFYHCVKLNKEAQRFSLIVLGLLSVAVLPVFFTGEPAEELVENLPGILEASIERHEDAAKISLISCLILGLASFGSLWVLKGDNCQRWVRNGILILGLVAMISLTRTGYMAGKIRHSNEVSLDRLPISQELENEKEIDD